MTVLQFRNASKEHALGAFGVALGVAMVAIGNMVPSLSFMADGGNVLAIMSFVASLAKRGEKTAAESVATLDSQIDKRLAGQTNVIKDNTQDLLTKLAGDSIDAAASRRRLESDRDAHAARLDAHDVKHAEHESKLERHGAALENQGTHIQQVSHTVSELAQKAGVNYQPFAVIKTGGEPA